MFLTLREKDPHDDESEKAFYGFLVAIFDTMHLAEWRSGCFGDNLARSASRMNVKNGWGNQFASYLYLLALSLRSTSPRHVQYDSFLNHEQYAIACFRTIVNADIVSAVFSLPLFHSFLDSARTLDAIMTITTTYTLKGFSDHARQNFPTRYDIMSKSHQYKSSTREVCFLQSGSASRQFSHSQDLSI